MIYSSSFVDDTTAEEEYRSINPHVSSTRIVKFRSGRYRRTWVGNVVAIGNSAGFVEPLEATALMILCAQARYLAEALVDSQYAPGNMLRDLYNQFIGERWDEIRDFLAIHYRFNQRQNTRFWQHCRRETPLHGADPIYQFYRENGPSMLVNSMFISPNDQFGAEGYLTMFLGMQVPHQKMHQATPSEKQLLTNIRSHYAKIASQACGVEETLRTLRDPRWVWRE